jgi:hypothetical protein
MHQQNGICIAWAFVNEMKAKIDTVMSCDGGVVRCEVEIGKPVKTFVRCAQNLHDVPWLWVMEPNVTCIPRRYWANRSKVVSLGLLEGEQSSFTHVRSMPRALETKKAPLEPKSERGFLISC